MITGVVVVPGAPAFLPTYAGSTDVLADLRSACLEAVEEVASDADRIVLVSATDRAPRHTGTTLGARVGAVLLDGRPSRAVEVDWDAAPETCVAMGRDLVAEFADRGSTAVVVVADGSACRSLKAPGHLDQRSFAFDQQWVSALRRADADALAALDPTLGADLLAQGRAPLQVLAGVLETLVAEEPGWLCASLEESDPFGVQYVVARLTRH